MTPSLWFATALTLTLPLLPLFFWQPTRRLAPLIGLAMVAFVWAQPAYLTGQLAPFHDTRQNHIRLLYLMIEWLATGNPLGWNPYLGAGQPLAVLNNFFLFAPSLVYGLLLKLLPLGLDRLLLMNQVWLFAFLSFVSGSVLCFQAWFKRGWVTLFGAASVLFGGFFAADLGEPVSFNSLYLLPWVGFFLLRFLETGRATAMALALFFAGLTANRYLPHYSFYASLVLFMSFAVFCPRQTWAGLRRLFFHLKNPKVWLGSGIALMISLGPVALSFQETRSYLSPTRGFSDGQVAGENTGFQVSIGAPLSSYSALWDHSYQASKTGFNHLTHTHGPVFIGLWLLVFLPLAIWSGRGRALLFAALILAWLGAGPGSGLWDWAQAYVPGFGLVRHGFTFARLVSYLVLLAGLEGLGQLIKSYPNGPKLLVPLFLGAWASWPLFSYIEAGGFVYLSCLTGLAVLGIFQMRRGFVGWALLLMWGAHLTDLTLVNQTTHYPAREAYDHARNYPLEMLPVFPFKYPARWGFSPPEFKGIPFDIRPMERKELYWSNQRFNLMVWWPQEMTPLFLALQSQPGNLFLEGPRFLAFEAKAPLAQLELADWRDLFLCHAFAEIKETPRPKPEQARFLGILKTDARLQSRCDALPRPLALALQPAAETNPNRTHLNLSHDQPIQLLRLETYHPDWRAKLDGASLVGIRLNPPFSLYQIPAGPHQLDFSFVSLYAFVVWLHLAAWLGVTLGLPLWLTQNPVPSLAPPPRGA